jgi:excisionase family DNA binding protein
VENTRTACKLLGVTPQTLRKWERNGQLSAIRTPGGKRLYDVAKFLGASATPSIICYCRASSSKQRDDLERQVEFMRGKYPQAEIVKDIGSGLNFRRKGLVSLLERAHRGDKLQVVVAHRDRLTRFGFDLIKWSIERSGGEIVVLNNIALSPEVELTQDLLNILHVFSCRMHGLRNYKKQVGEALSHKEPTENVPPMDSRSAGDL